MEPVVAPEQGKVRPNVVVSRDDLSIAASHLGVGMITMVPLTTNVRRVLDFQVLVAPAGTGLSVVSKAQPEQIRSVSYARIVRRIGAVDAETLAAVDEGLRIHLAL